MSSFAEHSGRHSLAHAIDFKKHNHQFAKAAAPPKKQDLLFPMIKTSEIRACLNELQIPITEDELKNPENNLAAIYHMFELLAEICLGLTKDDISQGAFKGLQKIDHPAQHEGSIPKMNLFRACLKMMELCDVKDFSIKDFISPTALRLRIQLSGVINFAKFREGQLRTLGELDDDKHAILDKAFQLRDTNASLNSRLNLLREQTAEEGDQIQRLEEECLEFEATMAALNKQQELVKEEMAALTAESRELKEHIAVASVQFEDATVLQKKLAVQIVSSPEKFRDQIKDVGQSLQQEQRDAKAAERKVRDLSAWLTHVEETAAEVDGALDAINDVRDEVERQKRIMHELVDVQQSTAGRRKVLAEVDQNVRQLENHVGRSENKLSQLRKQVASRSEEMHRAVEDMHGQLVDAEAQRVQVHARADSADGEATRVDREAEAEYLQQEHEIADIVSSYQRLERVVTSHLHGLQRVCAESRQQSDAQGRNFV